MPVKAGYLVAAGGGAILLWSGVKGHSWSNVLRDVVNGQKPGGPDLPITTSPATYQGSASQAAAQSAFLPGGGGSATKNQAIARLLAAPYGWSTGQEWNDLVLLWDKESSWNNYARNTTSGAYGVPQALPASKMGILANPPVSSASAQIAWGLKYIKDTYGDPVRAWAHEQSAGWY